MPCLIVPKQLSILRAIENELSLPHSFTWYVVMPPPNEAPNFQLYYYTIQNNSNTIPCFPFFAFQPDPVPLLTTDFLGKINAENHLYVKFVFKYCYSTVFPTTRYYNSHAALSIYIEENL